MPEAGRELEGDLSGTGVSFSLSNNVLAAERRPVVGRFEEQVESCEERRTDLSKARIISCASFNWVSADIALSSNICALSSVSLGSK